MTVPEHRRSAPDVVATVVLSVLTTLIAAASVVFSGFFVMATDSCGWHECDESRLGWAYGWTWGGVVVAALVALVGIVVANRRGGPCGCGRRWRWWW